IIAEPTTITGSIGVFGLIPNVTELMNEKIGIHFDTVRTAKYANGVVSPFQEVGSEEAAIIQESVDRTYEAFLGRVAEGRNMTRDQVHEIAQGRVWTGRKALEIGLVDQLGDLDDALALAAEMAEIDEYRLSEYPKIKDPMQKLLEDLTGQKLTQQIKNHVIKQQFPETTELLTDLEYMLSNKNPLARLPFQIQLQ
ncbi:MAG: S49 family peptidase, partial [Saprospiraceae bacterium]|nr:S49 family peptidase [Saprospiraceae bacterium]